MAAVVTFRSATHAVVVTAWRFRTWRQGLLDGLDIETRDERAEEQTG
jgi:hypothetical protein